jgi:hypothetical protein
MTTVPKHRYGGARALVLLHDQYMREFVDTWKRARAAGAVLPQSPDPNYASMEHLLFHVMRAGRGYMTWMCECLELPAPDIRPTPDVAALPGVLNEYVEHLLEGWKTPLVDVPEERFEDRTYESRWKVHYCIDAMLEHAVMHPIRHGFQLRNLMAEKHR